MALLALREMIKLLAVSTILLLALAILTTVYFRELQRLAAPYRWNMTIETGVYIPTRDNEKLHADVMLPTGEGQWPTVLIMTPYAENNLGPGKYFTQQGYAVISQQVRGRLKSSGVFTPQVDAGRDGEDVLDWITRQPWSDGKVVTYGCSYRGETQIALARMNHPAHVAAVPQGAGGAIGSAGDSHGYFGIYENGVLQLASAAGWFATEGYKRIAEWQPPTSQVLTHELSHLPLAEIVGNIAGHESDFEAFVTLPLGDPAWHRYGYVADSDLFNIPALHVNTWYDQTTRWTFQLAETMGKQGAPQYLLIGPGNHCKFEEAGDILGEMPISNHQLDWNAYYLAWFEHWTRGKPLALPPIRVFVLGANEWTDHEQWPPENTGPKALYLDNEPASLSPDPPVQGEGFDEFTYDPLDPLPTLGGAICCIEQATSGAYDQRPQEQRQDVLVYTTPELEEPLRLLGNQAAVLYVSSQTPDTDFTVKLIDVWPDGRAFNIMDSVGRLSLRHSLTEPVAAKAGEVYELEIPLGPMAYQVNVGHRLRVHLSSSNFPRLERNLNTFGNTRTTAETMTTVNRVYRAQSRPSRLQLTVQNP